MVFVVKRVSLRKPRALGAMMKRAFPMCVSGSNMTDRKSVV